MTTPTCYSTTERQDLKNDVQCIICMGIILASLKEPSLLGPLLNSIFLAFVASLSLLFHIRATTDFRLKFYWSYDVHCIASFGHNLHIPISNLCGSLALGMPSCHFVNYTNREKEKWLMTKHWLFLKCWTTLIHILFLAIYKEKSIFSTKLKRWLEMD